MSANDFTGGVVPSDNMSGGSFDVADTDTTTTPISITGGGGFVQLTNNGLGSQTNNSYPPNGITELWDTTDDDFSFSQLNLGDIVDIRADITVITAAPNTQIELILQAGIGVSAFPVSWDNQFYGSADTYSLVRSSFVTMQTTTILNGTAEFQFKSDKTCTVTVNGWNYYILRRG